MDVFVNNVLNRWLERNGIDGELQVLKSWTPGPMPVLASCSVEIYYLAGGKARRISRLSMNGNINNKESIYKALLEDVVLLFMCGGESIIKSIRANET